MSNVPRSLTDSSLTLFKLAISGSDLCNNYKHHVNFHLHIQHLHHHEKEVKDIPKGCVAIMVGQGEEQQRFVIPVIYINHPLFMELLKVAEEEYGFDQKGPITIPCHVEEFRNVQGMIDKDRHHHHHHIWCFRV
ncbi:auxin-responsive protein SAUR32-like [Hibiscus syriacus]|uniref:auxin-responsive protein SAUR32-like n=1 Tax=Hibiscus syriacus TaxID=106335 RepID=UPI001924322A|nr:auxin-responsive protein SAUR32-like [Hibiscus syriacus]